VSGIHVREWLSKGRCPALYDVETRARGKQLDSIGRQRLRQMLGRPIADSLHQWLTLHRQKVPEGSATAKAIDYSLNRREALTRYLDDDNLPIDDNWLENRIRPVTLGRSNWLFAGSLRAGRRVSLSQGRARTTADSPGQSHRGSLTSSWAVGSSASCLTAHC
jgi:hypothetical protein